MKRFVFLLFLVIFFTACKSTSPIVTSKKGAPKEKLSRSEKRKTNQLAEQLIEAAADNLGIKYKYAGTTKAGYDCSGLMYSIFNAENITLPRNSLQQSKIGVVLNPKKDQAQKGDLIFFKTNKNREINHVGIVIEASDEEIKFIHSSTSKGVIISSTKEPYYQKTFVQINRVL
ncbi:NlpC/P60 family protein [Flavobacterium petrolei]|uniref:NlpC/P60 family protein n=1 Tax=Flavobacterium petrolei TaxID=2259594 RepID=A0A482U4I6_9FLAO|nr:MULTISPECIES: C40 family peptidase [Flavobacterium]MDD2674075.1 C40 family peptidase [Flavobacterium sp.]QIH39288.1 C40 family peptidase [Flavobacterium sp. Sr18]RYJ53600.1 NlpC/P60 family protein [Flavobacterium petrolei]